MEKKRLNVWVEEDLYDQALERARAEDLTLSQVIRSFLRRYVSPDIPDEPSQRLRDSSVDDI